jgi:hypothetical protein
MPSKFDLLREGQAVEVEPGVSGRLNKDKRRLELSTGEVLDVSNDPDFFPRDQRALSISKEKEQIQRGIGKNPLGEFGYQFSQKGLVGGAKDWIDYSTQTADNYAARKAAQSQVSGRIEEESPWTSRAATAASFVPDIALTRGMSAFRAAPLLALGSAGSRIVTEPGEVAKETALAAAGGKGLDMLGGYFSRVAGRRGASRALPGQQAAVQAENIAGQQAVNAENAAQRQSFNALQERVKNENAARLHQHNLELTSRQNRMAEAQSAYQKATAARDAEIGRLKTADAATKAASKAEVSRLEQEARRLSDEYKLAEKQYQQQLKDLPSVQKKAQEEYSSNVLRNVEDIEKSFPKNSRLLTDQLGTQEFIDQAINSTGLAGSREGAQASRILKSLFPEGEMLGSKDLAKRYRAIEEAIQRAESEVQNILSQYKEFMGKRLPSILEDTIAYQKIVPALEKGLEKEITSILAHIPLGQGGRTHVANIAKTNLKSALRELGPDKFVEKLQSGELSAYLKSRILTAEDMLAEIGVMDMKRLKKQGLFDVLMKGNDIEAQHAFFINEIGSKIDNQLARSEIKVMQAAQESKKKLGRAVKKTYGLAEPVPSPQAPIAPEPYIAPEAAPYQSPQFPGPIPQPEPIPIPPKPSLMAEPTAPTSRTFSPQPEPTLPPPSGMADRMGDALEKPFFKGQGTTNNLLKLGALKYALGPAALPLEAAAVAGYGGLKALTSPGAVGQAARMTFKQGGIQAIEQLASKYPSYHDGVLDSPQDRRSLTKEIDDDPEIPIEQKAVLQSKVNRGKPLSQPLQ